MNLPAYMKCIVYGLEVPQMQIRPTPKPRRGHILVRVEAVGLNPVDAKEVVGDKLPNNWTYMRSWIRSQIISKKIPGFDFAGTCVEDSSQQKEDVKRLLCGEKVFGTMPPLQGTLAEFISVPIDQVTTMPLSLKFEEAAALPLVGLTAIQCLSSHVSTNTSILVIGGSGGTGHVALQIARCLGSNRVTTICSQRNKDFCLSCGAMEVIDYTKGAEYIIAGLMQSPHKPFNVVMDCVSSAEPRDMSMNYPLQLQQHPSAKYFLSDDYVYRRLGGPTTDWIRAGLERTTGLQWWPNQHEKLFWIRFPSSTTELQQIKEWVNDGKLLPRIDATYEFSEEGVKKAFGDLLSRRVQGKCVVVMSENDAGKNY